MLRPCHQPLTARVLVQVIPFLTPESLRLDLLRVKRRLPEAVVAITPRGFDENAMVTVRHGMDAEVDESSPRELAKIRKRGFEPVRIVCFA